MEILKSAGDEPFKVTALLAFLHGVRELSKIRKSVERLNVGMAVVVEKIGGHEKRISTLERKRR